MNINVDQIDEEIKKAKAEITEKGVDYKKAFQVMDAKIEKELQEIESLVAKGLSPIPLTKAQDKG